MRMHCPCCDHEATEFLPFGVKPRPNARCPRCGSLERHRLLWMFLRGRGDLLRSGMTLLHVAPERALRRLVQSVQGLTYIAADLSAEARVRLDVSVLPFRRGTLHGIICNHVLEHVSDDRRALREFRDAMHPSGWAILQSPIDASRDSTFEDPSVADPVERERLFGQHDHVRVYGRDYADRLRAAGFSVDEVDVVGALPAGHAQRYGLRFEPIYVCHPA